MSIEIDGTAPYAPAENVLAVIRRFREKGLPEVLNSQELIRLSLPEGNATRTLRALRFLGLLDNDGQRTAHLDRLGRASTAEYPQLFGEILRAAYHDVFVIVDPANTNLTELNDAFRHYEPQAQRERMVRLFVGLCREAELLPGGPLEPGKRVKAGLNGKSSVVVPSRRMRVTSPKHIVETPDDGDQKANTGTRAQSAFPWNEPSSTLQALGEGYLLLQGLLRQLPPNRQWTLERREQWLKAMTAMLDFLIEVVEPPGQAQPQGQSEQEMEMITLPSS